MASRLLLWIVESLGEYIHGFDDLELIKECVLSGDLKLKNLQLKPSVLNGLGIPITITHSWIESAHVSIPWNTLGTSPVRITIEGILLQASPADISTMRMDIMQAKANIFKKGMVDRLEVGLQRIYRRIVEEFSTEGGNLSNFAQCFMERLLINLEIAVTKVHFRFENDSPSSSNTTSAFGIILDSIHVNNYTICKKAVPIGSDKILNKAIKIDNIGIYWFE